MFALLFLLPLVGMALTGNGIFSKFKNSAYNGDAINLNASADVRVVGINATGVSTLVATTSDFLDDVLAAWRTHGPTALTSETYGTVGDGVFDAANLVGTLADPNNANGATTGLIFYIFNASEAAARLICYVTTGTGFPLAQDGTADDLTFDAAGIFTL